MNVLTMVATVQSICYEIGISVLWVTTVVSKQYLYKLL